MIFPEYQQGLPMKKIGEADFVLWKISLWIFPEYQQSLPLKKIGEADFVLCNLSLIVSKLKRFTPQYIVN